MRRISLLFLVLALFACQQPKKTANTRADCPPVALTDGLATSSKGNVVAEINGETITEQDIAALIKSRISRIENQLYDIKRDAIDQIVEDKLINEEAKKRNISVQDLLKKEVQEKVGEISPKEVEKFYNDNKARVGNKPLEELKGPIEAQLKATKSNTYRSNFLNRLIASANVDVYIKRPSVEVPAGNSPSRGGPASAPVTIIEFTDFQCPFCTRARPTVNQIIDLYKNDVHYVMRNFPLEFHSFAKKAASAALCANDQNKYWDYSTKLWENQTALDVASLKKYAADLKLDSKQFDECVDSDKYLKQVNQDQQDGAKVGVSGTPSFFVNGKMLTGAQPLDAFKKLIDEELRDAKKKKS